jgi:hypothetical protein
MHCRKSMIYTPAASLLTYRESTPDVVAQQAIGWSVCGEVQLGHAHAQRAEAAPVVSELLGHESRPRRPRSTLPPAILRLGEAAQQKMWVR